MLNVLFRAASVFKACRLENGFPMCGLLLFSVMFSALVVFNVLFRLGNQHTICSCSCSVNVCCVQMLVQVEHLFMFSERCSVPLLFLMVLVILIVSGSFSVA